MKKLALLTGSLLALALTLGSCSGEPKQDKVLRHVVMFGFKPEVTAEQVKGRRCFRRTAIEDRSDQGL